MKLGTYHNLRVPNFSVHLLRELLENADLDWQTALANAELDPGAVSRPGGTIPAKKELAFQLQFVALTKDRVDLWIQAARAYTLGSYGIRGLALVTAPTIDAWVKVATKPLDYSAALFKLATLQTPDGSLTGIEFTYPGAPEELLPFSAYRDLCVIARIFTWQYGEPFPFTRIEFPLAEASPEIFAYVPCRIDCGSETLRLWWDPAASTRQLPNGNAFQHATWSKADTEILDTLRATGDWPDTVAKTIRAAPDLNRRLANVAATLRVSPRTLQRKLELTGDDFAQLRDMTLSELASDLLLNSDYSISRISRTLGYSEPASFTIAFKRWKGMPPMAYREGARYKSDIVSNG